MPAPEIRSQLPQPSLSLEAVFDEIRDDLERVEQIIRDKVDSKLSLVESSGGYIFRSGGKRVRPALVLLASRACGYEGDKGPGYGAVTEFIHTATLVHDDIVDEAVTRRGKQSVNALLGNDFTVLLGDFLYIRSIGLAIELGSLGSLEVITEITLRMIEGMILELTRGGAVDLTVEEHLDILERKTAYLFFGCARIGAKLGDAPEEVETALGEFGMKIGMAFQVADDLLDFTSDEKTLGKPVLSDLKEGHVTLPIIYALEKEPGAQAAVQAVIDRGSIDEAGGKDLIDLVQRTGGLEKARELAENYALEARACLDVLPDSRHKEALQALAYYVIARNR